MIIFQQALLQKIDFNFRIISISAAARRTVRMIKENSVWSIVIRFFRWAPTMLQSPAAAEILISYIG